jgi:hypothetical protein
MINIRIFPLDEDVLTPVDNLVIGLSSLHQWAFDFSLGDIPFRASDLADQNGLVQASKIEKKLDTLVKKKFPQYYPIGVCSAHLTDDLISSRSRQSAVVSVHDWSSLYPDHPVVKVLAYCIADVLMGIRVSVQMHEPDTRGCPSDLLRRQAGYVSWPGGVYIL